MDYLYTHLDLAIDMDSRIALVGPNGAGKSTLLKLMIGEIDATEGSVRRHGHLKIAYYNQHSEAQLELALSPIQYLQKRFAKGVMLPGADKKVRASVCGSLYFS